MIGQYLRLLTKIKYSKKSNSISKDNGNKTVNDQYMVYILFTFTKARNEMKNKSE